MVTFSDLITLLLTFFVLLISMSSMDVQTVRRSFGMFSGAIGPMSFPESGRLKEVADILNQIQPVPSNVTIDRNRIKELLFDFEGSDFQNLAGEIEDQVEVFQDERGLVVQLADSILFEPGQSRLKLEYTPALSRVADMLRLTRRPVSIEGHTDRSAAEGGLSVDAWDLSLTRAISVLNFFIYDEGLFEDRFRVGGFGPSRPVAPGDAAGDRSQNRRIEIIIYKD
jgi:chemotaxis protein MotB